MNKYPEQTPYVVGIGASARGLEAVQELVAGLDDDPGLAFVVVQHLSPDHSSNLVDLLQEVTDLDVEPAEDGTVVESNHIYVISPGDQLTYEQGVLRTEQLPELESGRDTIDFLFRALAEELEERAIGVLLSGAGSDGTAGLRLIERHGGITIAQEPEEAGVRSMPGNAIEAGIVDFVDRVADIPGRLAEVTASKRQFGPMVSSGELVEDQARTLEEIMEIVRQETGNDLSNYKRSTMLRRIGRRMQIERLETLEAFRDFLETDKGEVHALLDEMLIKVTGFFRDATAWRVLRDSVVPSLFDGKGSDDQVRVWVPGCSTGEEAYTVAMLLDRFAETIDEAPEIKVFATDIDHDAIDYARRATYPMAVASDVPPEYLKSYFRVQDRDYRIVESIRNAVVFAPQNALTDPPFSDLDLVTCRNLLIYFQPEAQERLLKLIYYGLDEAGFLMLGRSEAVSAAPELFEPFDEEQAIFRAMKEDSDEIVPGTVFGFEAGAREREVEQDPETTESTPDLDALHRDAALASQNLGGVLVNERRRLLHTIGETSPYLSVPIGEPTDDLLEMLVDRFRPAVSDMLFEAFSGTDETLKRSVRGDEETGALAVEIRATHLEEGPFDEPVVSVTFRPISPSVAEQMPVPASDDADQSVVEQYERQLAQLRERLEETTREYQSSNERLRASNEELMSMNEELQSTTEELETSKEELQSLNEELQTVNAELNEKIRELNAANSDLRNLMRSTNVGTLFLDRQLRVERYTESVTELFNIQLADEGRPLEHLTHSLKVESIVEDARQVLDDLTTVEREVETDDGRWFLFRALPYLTVDDTVDGVVLTFVEITERRRIQEELADREQKFRTVFESAADPMVIYRIDDGEPEPLVDVNTATIEKTGLARERLETMSIGDLLGGKDFDLDGHIEDVERDGKSSVETRLAVSGPEGWLPVEATATQMVVDESTVVVEVLRDISAQRRYEQALLDSKKRAEELAELRSMFLSTLSHDVRSPLSTVLMTVSIMRDRVDEEDLHLLDSVERSCRQLQQTLDSILRMAKLESRESAALPEYFDIVDKVHEVVDLNAPVAEREELDLNYDGPDAPVEVHLDPRFMTQILNNLVDNALKYTEEGSVDVRLTVEDDRVAIEVVDTGIGIDKEDRALIFERFETASDIESHRFDSSGLGLAITRLLVDAMDGEVDVESTPGEGSTFRVAFPREMTVDYDKDARSAE